MVPIMGLPLLSYHLRWLKAFGIKQVIICCGYKSDVIQQYFGDGEKLDLQIVYSIEQQPLGRGGAIKAALKLVTDQSGPVLAMNGDLMTNLRIEDFYAFHTAHGALASVVTVPLKSPYGITEFEEDNTITAFREKPELPFWVNAGIYMFEPRIAALLPDTGDHETTTFPVLAAQRQLKAFKTRSYWRTIDTVKDLAELQSEMENFFVTSFLSPTA
jgi:NDP-sugar pyrophosphorylase family protein